MGAKVWSMHGKILKVFHDQETILKDVLNPLMNIQYHSPAVKSDILLKDLKISAISDDGIIMGVRHN